MMKLEFRPDGDELEIWLDGEGLATLSARLRFLEKRQTDHVLLFSDEWQGEEQGDLTTSVDGKSVHHVKIIVRDV